MLEERLLRPLRPVSQLRDIRHKVLPAMTSGADTGEVLVKASALAIASVLFTLPYFHYLTFVVLDGAPLPEGLDARNLLRTQLFLLFIVCLLSAMVGFSFSRRFKLPGFGNLKRFVQSLPLLFVLAAIMTALSYFFFDRYFFQVAPISYPGNSLYLMSIPFKGAFTEEIILRLCLVTLGVGLLHSKGGGVVLVSIVAPFFTIKYFHFLGMEVGLNYLFVVQLILSFAANLLLGYLFVTHGLLHSMALKFMLGMKYFLVSWAMG